MSMHPLHAYLRERSGPLLFLLAFLALLVVPFRIHLYNYAPQDDARRHVAKVVSGREWPDVLVLNQAFAKLDHNEGWHVILTGIHRLGLEKQGLLELSSIGLFLVFVLAGLWLHRNEPEAWLAAMLAASLMAPGGRLMLGRPFVLAAAIFLVLLHLWREPRGKNLPRLVASTLLFALAAWVHGSWYLFALMPLGLACCGRFREAALNAATWLGGSVLGASLTGRPIGFLADHLIQAKTIMGSSPVTRLLVSEFQPSLQFIAILLVLALVFWKQQRGEDFWQTHGRNPAFWLMFIGWILGFKNGRFWADWGAVAFVGWTASTLAPEFRKLGESQPIRRLLVGGLLASGMYLCWTADAGSRWSNNDFNDPLNLEDPAHAGWLPEEGGILYSDSMLVFYQTFYANPDGPWRYILGYEAALMPVDDLEILRDIQFYRGDVDHLFKPWIDKFTPADRLVLQRAPKAKPEIPGLEWNYVAYQTWVGRLPRSGAAEAPALP